MEISAPRRRRSGGSHRRPHAPEVAIGGRAVVHHAVGVSVYGLHQLAAGRPPLGPRVAQRLHGQLRRDVGRRGARPCRRRQLAGVPRGTSPRSRSHARPDVRGRAHAESHAFQRRLAEAHDVAGVHFGRAGELPLVQVRAVGRARNPPRTTSRAARRAWNWEMYVSPKRNLAGVGPTHLDRLLELDGARLRPEAWSTILGATTSRARFTSFGGAAGGVGAFPVPGAEHHPRRPGSRGRRRNREGRGRRTSRTSSTNSGTPLLPPELEHRVSDRDLVAVGQPVLRDG